MSLFEGASGERVPIGSPNTTATVSNVFSVWGPSPATHTVSAPFQATNYPITSGSTYFVLMKVVTDGTVAVDTAYIWVNWTNLTIEPTIGTATFVQNEVNLSSINNLRLQASNQNGNGSNAVFQADELRVGTTFADVVPQAAAPATPPAITSQPANLSVVVGDPATFTVNADGTAPLRYQWYFNTTTPLAGKTNATLTFAIASANDAGNYSAIVTNSASSVTSSEASLVVVPASPAGLPAFPGADVAAEFITGGRGGIVYHVTKLDRNMNHSEAGTLRYGLTDGNFPPGVPRTIVFDVAGTFWLGRFGAESNHMHGWDAASRYNLSGNTTIAGQTAPGPVIIGGGVTKASSVNTIARNITFAPS